MHGPLIGITTSELRTPDRVDPTPSSEPPQRELALGLDYPVAVAAGGGLPVVLPPHLDQAEDVVSRLDGLVLAGGPDINPALYAHPPHANLGPNEPATDAWELALLTAALERGLPVLAICRGMQLLNVAYGGTLWQDINTELELGDVHRQKERGSEVTHDVEVDDGTQLAALTGGGTLAVNSFHHQAVQDLGSGLRITARDQGLVEAIEDPARPFVIGVQWHAESLYRRPAQLALFQGLVATAATSA
ncbi:MAG: gamma-glutamyl-gamma-aminobutyrate hydrolase family protein [Solirubrobacteraceae bacterium]|nr:gamma-glutamyl-gamma-aminobutyrate hydrolase family protein [Solirubrobacteraceae bacterium]